ncbi:Abi family protein [Pseudomonas mosselii]|uniref:Abi family protein n=1 Tax=Pseudomonas mosselii TaxID=78327 RepID=UPI0021DA0DCB|nr:Abi family protein [Pseudomonas mosselii]MCU9529373.1 Abi family protein [Pseudomonas mosselii]MCU9536664.1 Abi family protein [Pseudomonas mosselii]MCU9542285.1 Abi family protein [Pseudomonas mosselii]MCU9548389.1 Abi family protein [Pseudomonas mosselii]
MSFMSPDLAKQAALSIPRMGTYLAACNNQPSPLSAAVNLYAWNAAISAAFIHPLHFCEVVVRNAVSEALTATYGVQWPWNQGFYLSLPEQAGPVFKPRQALLAARLKAEQIAGANTPSTDKAIAEMSFAFWESMFTARYDHGLWDNHIKRLFPHAPAALPYYKLRSEIRSALEAIRKFRNRIAHHEPIFARQLAHDYARIQKIVKYRCVQTANWMAQSQTVNAVLADRP